MDTCQGRNEPIRRRTKNDPFWYMKNDKKTTPSREGDTLGYARVSTADQDLAGQKDRLEKAGAIRIFTDVMSGSKFDRSGLAELLDHARPGTAYASRGSTVSAGP